MSKKRTSKSFLLIGAVVLLTIVAGAYALGKGSTSTDTENLLPGKLEIVEKEYNFGTIGLDKASHVFVVKNIGEGPLTINHVSTSCGCTSAQLNKNGRKSVMYGMDHGNLPKARMILEPGEETDVIVTYDPLAHGRNRAAGYFQRMVYIKTDNPKGEHQLTVEMTVDPNLNS